MNHIVEVRYQKNEKYPQVLIDGEQISRYMELSEYIYDDIFCWAVRLFESMDDELSEDYSVELTGHAFQHEVLKATQSVSQYCKAVKFRELTYKIPLKEKYAYALKLNREYAVARPLLEECVTFCCEDPSQFAAYTAAKFETDSSNYYVTYGTELPAKYGKYCVMIGQSVGFVQQRGTNIIKVTESLMPTLIDYFNTYHIYLGFVNTVFSSAAAVQMPVADKLEYEAYATEEYRVLPAPIPSVLECGESFTVQYQVYPPCFEDPGIFLSSDVPSVISCAGNELRANREGECAIKMIDKYGREYHSHKITVERHTYVNNITVTLSDTVIRVGQSTTFKCVMTPGDAEDINQVQYSVSNPDIVGINPYQSELIGLAPGRACIVVATPRVTSRFYVSVTPDVSEVLLPTDHLDLPYYADAIIEYTVFPASVKPKPVAVWGTSNKGIVDIVKTEKNGCRIRAKEYGQAIIQCRLKGTDITKTIKVNVVKHK